MKNKQDLLHEIENDLLEGLKEALVIDREELKDVKHLPGADEIKELYSWYHLYTVSA